MQFDSLRGLLLHPRRSKAANHGAISNFYKAAHVNQCPWYLWFTHLLFLRAGLYAVGLKLENVHLIVVAAVWFLLSPWFHLTWFASFVERTVLSCRSLLPISDHISLSRRPAVRSSMESWIRRSNDQKGPPAKVRVVSPREDSELVRKALLLVSKMTLRQELEIRELQAAVFRSQLGPRSQSLLRHSLVWMPLTSHDFFSPRGHD